MEPHPDAKTIIAAFDQCRAYIFGYAFARDHPHITDTKTANEWIDKGLSLVVAVMVFFEQMNWMHEKFLRYGQGKDRSYLPASLKVFNDNIEAAIRKSKGYEVDNFDKSMSLWRSRCLAWKKNQKLWIVNMWGPPPSEKNNRVPHLIVEELGPFTVP